MDSTRRLSLKIGYIDSAAIRPGQTVISPARRGEFTCDYGYGIELQKLTEAEFSAPQLRR
jgi:hypothetical protein